MADDDARSDRYEARVTAAIEYLRGNVKWTLVAFGAIGTTLLAGSQLSNLGKFQYSDPRLIVALLCAVVALGAAAIAIYSALKVAYTGYTEFYHLDAEDVAYIEQNPALLEGFGSVQGLREAYEAAVQQRHLHLTTEDKDSELIQSDQIWFDYLDELIDHVVSYTRYNRIRRAADKSRLQMTFASVIAAVALVGFAWAANPGADQPTVLHSPASRAKLALSGAGRSTLTPVLGAKCVALAKIDVVLLSASASGSEVVTVGGPDCPVARFTITAGLGSLASDTGAAQGAPPPTATAGSESVKPIIWSQVRPDQPSSDGELIARTIVARDAACPALTVDGTAWPMMTRADGSDPDFPIKLCEAAVPGNAKAQLGDVTLKPRPKNPRKILAIGDTGCRITDYTAQQCDDAADWPFFRIAKAASALKPDLIIHVGDYHYREKPCAGRQGCTASPYGDNWQSWNADFFVPAAPLLTSAPWLMLRGNHEDCPRAGAGWNLLIRPQLGMKAGERCPPESDPDLFSFEQLRLVVPDTASAEAYGKAKRVATYREQIRTLSDKISKAPQVADTWLITHQALWVSYGINKKDKKYDADELLTRVTGKVAGNELAADLCEDIVSPMDTYRQWFAGAIPLTNPHKDAADPKERDEKPCSDPAPAQGMGVKPPAVSLVLSGDTHTFQMFTPEKESTPLQLVVGNGGDALEGDSSYPDAKGKLDRKSATLFGIPGALWMRNDFGFAVLEQIAPGSWSATLYDVEGTVMARCALAHPGAKCEPAA